MVAGFVRFGLVRPCTLWGSLGSYWFVWFVRVRPGGRLFFSDSSASFESALGVAGFVRVRLVCSGSPRRSLVSFGFVCP